MSGGPTKITMLLAMAPWSADGDLHDQIQMRVRLDALGRPDVAAYEADPESWIATRQQPGKPVRTGQLMRAGEGWGLRGIRGDDEPIWDLGLDLMRPGEVVSLRQPDGCDLLFRIVAVEAA